MQRIGKSGSVGREADGWLRLEMGTGDIHARRAASGRAVDQ
jgi:hypothetical protein